MRLCWLCGLLRGGWRSRSPFACCCRSFWLFGGPTEQSPFDFRVEPPELWP